MTTDPSRHLRPRLDAVRAALDEASVAEPCAAVEPLSRARALLDVALDEALLAGSSIRSVAEAAGVAPNTVSPRIARTPALAGYSVPDGRVSAKGVMRARYDREPGTPPPGPTTAVEPLRFRRRT
ncbi:hypothetical protein ACF049_07740 [Cellulosimicrobium funkei]|uniref:hypothetical protein n=1 Tax=Cellulosimicrobium funkei TaxID=264251 RepID=UPI00370318E9